MDSETLQQLQDEIQQKLFESVNNADLYSVLEKYGVLEDRALIVQWQCNLDPNKIKFGDAVNKQQPNELLPAISGGSEQGIVLVQKSWCIPCPSTGDPFGCNC
ncbi:MULTISPECIES: hypothetical protein [Nostoc]|uniref:Nif11 domain-containing protein n=2 Tax=Nostoc TaxID=1177 RepID=A0ABR8ICF6_9NOSO|nr:MULTISPECIES: hypothetical protein [Nostoc]MBD2560337.1 hypothetical protein [Nostoc linckia FACHB-391]MBD2648681.1 hypothetical protein [Nostoc foliaceum FACHB-393]